ncbi:MAG TPA: DUF3341 domain-containing protein [Planctomycetaceae bacterium]|nr:DUF3341 domain-containing protein [Planctomycetaceae bacterium]
MAEHETPRLYGLMAKFAEPDAVLQAARRAYAEGYRKMDAYTPMPVEDLAEALGHPYTRIPYLTFIGGLIGAVGALFMMVDACVWDYPINVGGRPLNSWPAYIPITFELTVLGAAFFSLFGMLFVNGLPMPYHPVFNVEDFRRENHERFYLCIESHDPKFELTQTREFLVSLGALAVYEVEP